MVDGKLTRSTILGLIVLACSACGAEPSEPRARQPEGWDEEIAPARAVDLDPEPNVLRVELEAKLAEVEWLPGTKTEAWTYDGTVPGPLLRAQVGDRVIVDFTNNLPDPTTIHWHGLRIPAAMDGAPGHSQPAIQPGATFTYDFVVPDAGTFWYHPHVASAAQVGDGLYAPLIVDDPAEPAAFGDEVVLVLSDVALAPDGRLEPPDASGDLATVFGREGNVLLVNGKVRPTLRARPGLPLRLRVVNAAKSRYYQLTLPGHGFTRIGGDGGLLSEPIGEPLPVVIPGERADLVLVPQGRDGELLTVWWHAYDRGFGSTFNRPDEPLFDIRLEGEPAPTPALPELTRTIEPLDGAGATLVDIKLTLDSGTPLALGINGQPSWESEPVQARVGETQLWTVSNTMDWAHPFHLHGFFFQVLDRVPLEWKDTVDVPVNGTVRLLARYDDRPGMWMFHCHILDHADAGMMGMLQVGPGTGQAGHTEH